MAEDSIHQQVDNRIFSIAKNMVTQIEQRVESTLPSDEVWFIYQYIISSGIVMEERADNQLLRYQFSNGESRRITRALTQVFS
ncbi:PRD domain-containing protein, partial [Pectobacterium sp. FL60-S17]|uniref:PRD domain-containing protein n=2 Tax=Pectobacterium TaxID=122277 RepID=UPI0018744948